MLQRGFHVLPLRPRSKIPAVENWPEWSKRFSIERLEELPADYDGNFGVHPGPSGHFVLDIDCGVKNGKQGLGLQSLEKLIAKHGPLPKTFTVQTPTGGLHLYFKGTVANTNGRAGPNLDSRCEAGMVVAPGSVVDAGTYVIADDREPVAAPQWLLDALAEKAHPVLDRPEPEVLNQPSHVDAVVAYLRTAPICVEGSNGDIQLFRVFCQCRDLGVDRKTAVQLVLNEYNPRCQPPWSYDNPKDIDHLVQKSYNAYEYAQNTPGAKTQEATTAAAIADFSSAPLPLSPVEKNGVHPLPLLRASDIRGLDIPKRDWIIHGFLLGSFLSITGAPGGTGKSNFEILKAMAVVTGMPLLGDAYPVVKRGPVVLYNCEDPLDEMVRRVEAFRIDCKLNPEDLKDLHLVSGREHSLSVAGLNQVGEVEINMAAVKTLAATVRSTGAVLLSCDPMVRTHWLNENNNVEMDKVTQAFQRVSTETGCAVSLVHHTNKAAMRLDSADSASQVGFRGAGSLVASARVGHLLTTMGPEEAEKMGVPPEKRRWFFKVENAKANLSAPAESADWFTADGVEIPNGEVIGVCRRSDLATQALAAKEAQSETTRESTLAFLRRYFDQNGEDELGLGFITSAAAAHGLDLGMTRNRAEQLRMVGDAIAGTEFDLKQSLAKKDDWVVRRDSFLG